MMFDDDDDVESQLKCVDDYHFEDSKNNPVCFSILPFQFDENDEFEEIDVEKKVYLRGVRDKSLYGVHRKVVAWRAVLDCEQPNISVLSGEGNWIRLLKPRKCYKEEVARSILITVQMLHFVRKKHRDKTRLWGRLWDHLDEVFNKLDTKSAMDDLRKHHPLIKLFLERDPVLKKSKTLQRFIGGTAEKIKELKITGTTEQFIGWDDSRASNNDNDGDCDDDDNNNDGDYSYSRDDTEDDYNNGKDDSNSDDNDDGNTDSDDDTDTLCALCDDGGNLISCIGQCKRSFHPRKKDGRESKCKTLGYTSEQLKGIGTYLCKNCEYKQHQCFNCRELEPSDEPNAKVYKCNNPSCGLFYHPKCVAKLLEPDVAACGETCELEKRIMAGMSFTCPVHWCFECGRMGDRTQKALQLAVCRRCPKSYHRECLPREISFETKGKNVKQRAWELSKTIMIYCLDHKICKATGNARRGHIKFPPIQKISKVKDLGKKNVKMNGKRKRSVGECSTKSKGVLNRLRKEKNEHTRKVVADNSLEHMVLKPDCSALRLKEDLQIEPFMVEATSLSSLEDLKGQQRQLGTSSSCVMGTRMPSCAMDCKKEKRRKNRPGKRTSSGNIAKECVVPSEGMLDRSVQIAEELHSYMQQGDMENLLENPFVNKDARLDNGICRIAEDKDGNGKEKSSEHYSGKGGGATNNNTSHENNEQNDVVLGKLFVDKHTEGKQDKLKSREEIGMEWGEKAFEHESISEQEEEIYGKKNQLCRRPCEQDSRLDKWKSARNGINESSSANGRVTPDHVDDNPSEKQLHVPYVDKTANTDIIDIQAEYGCGEDQEVNGDNACQEEPNSSQSNDNPEAIDINISGDKSKKRKDPKATDGNNTDFGKNRKYNHIEDETEALYDDNSHQYPSNHKESDYPDRKFINSGLNSPQCNDENRVAETSEYKSKQSAGSSRREGLTHYTGANSSNSPMDRNAPKRPTNHSPEGQSTYRDMYGRHLGTNNQKSYEQQHDVNYSSNENYDSRSWGSLRPAFPPADFGASRWHDPRSYLIGSAQCITGWQNPPFYPSSLGFFTGRWHSPPFYPRGPEHAGHRMDWNNQPNLEYAQYGSNFNHGGYHAMGIDPTARYSVQVNNYGAHRPHTGVSVGGHGSAYGGRNGEYGVRSNYIFGWGHRPPAGGSVTDRYAHRLEETNNQPRGRPMF